MSDVKLSKALIEAILMRPTTLPAHGYTIDSLYADLRATATDETIEKIDQLIQWFGLFYDALDELFVCARNSAQDWKKTAVALGYTEEEDA